MQQLGIDVFISAQADEQWSFVQNKSQQGWTWYAIERKTKKVLAYVFGPRTDESYKKLINLLSPKLIDVLSTDNWGSYSRIKFAPIHIISKRGTQAIERKNLDLRTRIKRLTRKTICFSKSTLIHDAVIASFIELYMF